MSWLKNRNTPQCGALNHYFDLEKALRTGLNSSGKSLTDLEKKNMQKDLKRLKKKYSRL